MPWKRLIGPLQPVAATSGLRDWYRGVCNGAPSTDAFSQAVYGGRLATTPGLAFLAGYQAALRALWPDAPPGLGALCTTERRKLRPADMTTRCENGQLSGSKDFVTTGDAAQWLLVSAREEGAGESPRLGLFVIESTGVGVSLVAGPDLPIVPDIAHGRLSLEHALLEQFAALQPEVDRALMESQGSWNAMWKRDRAVLGIARDAQTRRLEQAITALAPGCS